MSEAVETQGTKELVSNPFPGLRPFSIDESHLFFGREGQSDEVLLKLSKNRFIGVIGPSGSGKSSFIYCGVLPILYGGFLTDTGPNWDVVVTRPGSAPIENLAHAVLEKDPNYNASDPEEQKIKRTITTTLLRSSSLGLVEAVLQTKRASNNNYLILVDQFEELFRFKDSRDNDDSLNETLAFVTLLMEAVSYSEVPIYVAITMRSDFIGECAQFPDLTKKINDSHYLIPQLTREQKRRAITGPCQVGGGEIAPRLIQQVLNDLGDNPDQLPILQHSLMRTWDYWSRHRDRDEPMDIKHYDAIGRMAEALSRHANEAFDELSDEQKDICETLFKAITEKRGENFGIRRPTRAGEIAAIADVSVEEVVEIVEKFREPGRSLLVPPPGVELEERSVIDISHESLMRIWVRLKNWVDDEAEAVQMYLRLSEAAAMYQVGKAGLWRPPDLQLALNWQQKHKPTLVWGQRYHPAFERTMVFLEYSKKEFETEQRIKELQAKRALKRARITALIMGGATVISLLFLLFAFAQKVEADKQRDEAQAQTKIAEEQRTLAQQNEQRAIEQQKIAEEQRTLAQQNEQRAIEQQQIAEEQRLLAEQQKALAQTNEQRAIEQQKIAEEQRTLAQENEQKAIEQQRIAQQERDRAEQLRYIAQAKAMGIKATKTLPDNNLKGLLAQQAYVFNTQYQGYEHSADVYGGLYEALKEFDDPLSNDFSGHDGAQVHALASSVQGDHIFSGGTLGKILQWDVKDGRRVADTLANNPDYLINSMAVSPDGQQLAVGGKYKTAGGGPLMVLYQVGSRSEPQEVSGIENEVEEVVYGANNSVYILDNLGLSIKKWQGGTTTVFAEVSDRINNIAASKDGRWVAAADNKGKVILWDLSKSSEQMELVGDPDNPRPIWSVEFDPASQELAAGDERGWVYMWKLTTLQVTKVAYRTMADHRARVNDIKFSSDGQFMATASLDRTVRLWNFKDLNKPPAQLEDHDDWVHGIAFSPDDNQLLAGTQDEIVKVWPTRIGQMSNRICNHINRNMSIEEWEIYVGEDLKYEKTCSQFTAGENATVGRTPLELKGGR